jgi:dipeptidyl aminopeptidase/acylaminoacyl peptidase
MKFTFFLSLLFLCVSALAQKKALDPSVYSSWKSVRAAQVSENGNFVHYEINPHRGDGYIYLHNNKTAALDSIFRGKNGRVSQTEDVFVFFIDPGFDTLRTLELEKVKKEKWIKDSLGILFLKNDSLVRIPNVKSIDLAKNSNWMAYLSHENEEQAPSKKERKCLFKKKKSQPETPKSEGFLLTLLNTSSGKSHRFPNVIEYSFDKQGENISIVSSFKVKKIDSLTLSVIHLKDMSLHHGGSFKAFGKSSFSETDSKMVFLASQDTAKNKQYNLFLWDFSKKAPQLLADTNRADLPEGLTASNFFMPYFSQNGKRLFFGLKEAPVQEEKDTLLDTEKAKLDVWHYNDDQLQPQQLLGKKREEKRTFLTTIDLASNQLLQLENDTIYVSVLNQGNGDYALATSKKQYEKTYNWNYPWPRDYYRIDLSTGNTELIKEKVGYADGLSPLGNYFVFYDNSTQNFMLVDLKTNQEHCMTCYTQEKEIWEEDVNGMPHDPAPIRPLGYTTNEQSFILHSEFDVWEYDLGSKSLISLTVGQGKYMNTELRMNSWNPDSVFINKEKTYIHGFDRTNKDERIYSLNENVRLNFITPLLDTPHKVQNISKAPNGNTVIYQKMNVTDYPDVYVNNLSFDNEKKISVANPQQSEYIWPTVELITWTSYSGKELEGLVYKPENFDPNKEYPMIVYFYELYSDRKNNHYIPKPTASIIYATEYTSAGYIVFMPDIRYEPGYPARGAYDCIMSGTDEVLKRYPNIDSTRMGLQGQSWGGYQTAQLITMTTRYKAAMAGAPVSNMFSAYGGIRWGSGLNRQFQYEKSQSRIGKTIWEAPELYVENSPLFHLPKVETPLLIMHNDADGAVPWYQGIELFVGMKRLGKPAWLLNYNGDDHNLMKDANRRDLSIRMRQFFDHYLLNEPAPVWLLEGLPAVEKGINYRLELSE